jgi:uncharacterized Zn finger protein
MMEKMIAREQNKADKEAEEWLKGVQEYLTQGGEQVKPAELAVALRGIKERLDEYSQLLKDMHFSSTSLRRNLTDSEKLFIV